MQDLALKCQQAAAYVSSLADASDAIGIVLGSGFGPFADQVENSIVIPYKDIPNFPISTAIGHRGEMVIGTIRNKKVVCMSGRFHLYEGYDAQTITLYVRVLKLLGIKALILTNAAGCINQNWERGDFMLIDDVINLTCENPLIGLNDNNLGIRFADMVNALSRDLKDLAVKVAEENNILLRRGVYLCTKGPSFETPAEIRMMRTMGADAVGMSTVLELICARSCSIPSLGLSCLTNMAAGITGKEMSTDEVNETGRQMEENCRILLEGIVEKLA